MGNLFRIFNIKDAEHLAEEYKLMSKTLLI